MNNQKHFFKLLQYENGLREKKKSLREDDPELFPLALKPLWGIDM